MQVIYITTLLLLIILCTLPGILTYKLPDVDFTLLKEGFRVAIPDEPGMKKVFYIVEINDMCPAHMDYILAAKDGTWSFEKPNVKLEENDKISIMLMVEQNDDIHINTQNLKIKNNQAVTVDCSSSTDVSDGCADTDTSQPVTERSCKRAQSVTQNGLPRCDGDLLFEDNFDTDLKLWNYEIRLGSNEEEEFVLFNDSPENSYIRDGTLNIIPTIASGDIRREIFELGDKCTVLNENECGTSSIDVRTQHQKIRPPINTAQINTKRSFNFKYGRIEIRAKLPKGDWIVPHISLKPVSPVSYRPQIYVAYARGNVQLIKDNDEDISGSRLYGGNVFWQRSVNPVKNLLNLKGKEHFGEDFHTYSLTWTKDRMSLSVDGVSYGDTTKNMSLFQEEFYITLGVSVGGHHDFPDKLKNQYKPWENTEPKAAVNFWKERNNWKNTWNGGQAMQIDYVRVYAV